MSTRRHFLKAGVVVGGAALTHLSPGNVLGAKPRFFGVHRFIEDNPTAVFVKKTNVSTKLDYVAKLNEGINFACDVFVLKEKDGIPLNYSVVIKPNAHPSVANYNQGYPGTQGNRTKYSQGFTIPGVVPIVDGMGINTDVHFTEGVIRGMKEKLGLKKFFLRECLGPDDWEPRGWLPMAERVGAVMKRPPSDIRKAKPDEVVYSDIKDGMIFNRYAHLAPTNESNTWLLNIAKMKGHGMCMTQACKNLQGIAAPLYVHMCNTIGSIKTYPNIVQPNIIPGFEERLIASWERHLKEGYPRWDILDAVVPPLRLETWAHRTLDHMSVLNPGLSVIEAIYARNGDFMNGRDFMTNLLIFGKNPVLCDIIGLWFGGHEPGNLGFHHIAVERGFAHTINPWDIPVYEFVDGKPHGPKDLSLFSRTSVVTYYLQKPGEKKYHLVNEPFDYDAWERKRKKEI